MKGEDELSLLKFEEPALGARLHLFLFLHLHQGKARFLQMETGDAQLQCRPSCQPRAMSALSSLS